MPTLPVASPTSTPEARRALRLWRLRLGLTQRALGALVGVSAHTITSAERSTVSQRVYSQLAAALSQYEQAQGPLPAPVPWGTVAERPVALVEAQEETAEAQRQRQMQALHRHHDSQEQAYLSTWSVAPVRVEGDWEIRRLRNSDRYCLVNRSSERRVVVGSLEVCNQLLDGMLTYEPLANAD